MKNYTLFLSVTAFALSVAAEAANYTSVDLGLSVRWATCNVGASAPEGTGDRYAWGETATKTTYSWGTYRYGTAYNTLTKYCTNSNYGTVDNRTTLEAADDAARQVWGDKWRTPTHTEWQELRTKCTWKWTDNYNSTKVKGYTVTATNGNAIFLPVTGFAYADQTQQTDEGYYWSSSLHTTPSAAYYVQFSSTAIAADNDNLRFYGQAVRAVEDLYTVTLVAPDNGQLQSDKTQAAADETVTLSVISDSHYVLQRFSVMQGTTEITTTAVAGAAAQYTFVMPIGGVTVTAEFQRIEPNFTPYPFSVNAAGKQVYFSSGNLQCAGLTGGDTVWSFAEYQMDIVGESNVSGSALADRIDLFGWSAAGEKNMVPWGIGSSTSFADYSGDFVDWGQNTIGDADPNTYRTLTTDEWYFLIHSRAKAAKRMGVGSILITNSGWAVNGLILLPDYLNPINNFKTGFVPNPDYPSDDDDEDAPDETPSLCSVGEYSSNQKFTLTQWHKLESYGAVFLPLSLYRFGETPVDNSTDKGLISRYWSSTSNEANSPNGKYYANCLDFTACDASIQGAWRFWGYAVRLVRDLKYGITLVAGANGTLVSDVEQCATGDKVTLTITPATGYSLGELTVTDANGQPVTVAEDYTFTMPAADVTVSASFVRQTATAVQSAEAQAFRVENGRIVGNGAFQIYDLLGRNMTHRNGQLHGVYIVRTGATTQKIVKR